MHATNSIHPAEREGHWGWMRSDELDDGRSERIVIVVTTSEMENTQKQQSRKPAIRLACFDSNVKYIVTITIIVVIVERRYFGVDPV